MGGLPNRDALFVFVELLLTRNNRVNHLELTFHLPLPSSDYHRYPYRMNTGRSAPIASGVNVENVSPAELYDIVTGASSQDPARVQACSKRLKQMLDMFGTFDGLHEIAAQRTVPLPVRQQAIIQFKNAALNHWKSRKSVDMGQSTRILSETLIHRSS